MLREKKIKVVVPLQSKSTRLPRKNIRDFYKGDSLFDIKAKQLIDFVDEPSDVYVSTDDPALESLITSYGFNYVERDASLTGNSVPWVDVVKHLVDAVPKGYDIAWVQVTQPLFNDFNNCKLTWMENYDDYDSLVVVNRLSHHIVDSSNIPLNFNYGLWHSVSQDLRNLYEISWSLFFIKRDTVDLLNYTIGRKPFFYESKEFMVDIDTPEDFDIAKVIYGYKEENKTK